MIRRSISLEEISEDCPSQQLDDGVVVAESCNGWRSKVFKPKIYQVLLTIWTIWILLSFDMSHRIIINLKLRYIGQIDHLLDSRGKRGHHLLEGFAKGTVNRTGSILNHNESGINSTVRWHNKSNTAEKNSQHMEMDSAERFKEGLINDNDRAKVHLASREKQTENKPKNVRVNRDNMNLSIVAPNACADPLVCSNDLDGSLKYSVQPSDNRPMIFRVNCKTGTTRFTAVEISVKGSIVGNFTVGFVNWVDNTCGKSSWPQTHLSSLVRGDRYAVSVRGDNTIYHIPISHFIQRSQTARMHSIQVLGFKTRPQTIHILNVKLTRDPAPPGWTDPGALPAARTSIFCRRPGNIALGIDDGGDALMNLTLDLLREAAVPATFFLVGRHLRKSRAREAFARRALAEGHTVQHHTWNHDDIEEMPAAALPIDLDRTLAVAREGFGVQMRYFRPPRGRFDATLMHELSRRNMSNVMWSFGLSDYGSATNESVWKLFAQAMKDHDPARVGLIGVQHFSVRASVELIPRMAASAREKGWRFVGMDECLGGEEEAKQ